MNNKNIIAIAVLVVLALSGYFIYENFFNLGILDIPLKDGDRFIYSARYLSRSGNREIKLDAPDHILEISANRGRDGQPVYILKFSAGSAVLAYLTLTREPDGIYLKSANKKQLIIPREPAKNREWEFDWGDSSVKAEIGARKEIKTAPGTFSAREIRYQDRRHSRLKIGIDPLVGIVRADISYIDAGPNRSEIELVLKEISSE